MAETQRGADAEPEINAKLAELVKELVLLEHRMSHRNRLLLAAVARWASDTPESARITPPPPAANKRASKAATKPLAGLDGEA